MKGMFKPSILKVGVSLGLLVVLFFVYSLTVPMIGPNCLSRGGESVCFFIITIVLVRVGRFG